jgi:hypothetical protein
MGDIHPVTIEILRHGPPHNQLLSPTTAYLAVCGNHPAVTLRIPFEHNQLKLRLRPMSYKDSAVTTELQLDDLSMSLATILGSIPGLIADAYNRPRNALIHLRLILSASELALLPFEISHAPHGFPGAGQPLLLQANFPICLTREVRRIKHQTLRWPTRAPRILFIAAQPPDAGTIPLESHLSVLRGAIEPWMHYYDPNDRAAYAEAIGKHLVLLPQANIEQIAEVCRRDRFTHVHILAHGARFERADSAYFGIALHDPRNPSRKSVVSGEKLANLLCGENPDDEISPAVVTLATCDSGNVGSVEGIGASVVHALHAAGIPLVIGSQFPLSFDGSVLMTKVLYEDLLWGADPRPLLSYLRWQLHSRVSQGHDWASLVAYASLPEDFDTQMPRVRLRIANEAINAAMDLADTVIRDPDPAGPALVEKAMSKIDAAKARVAAVHPHEHDVGEVEGLLASTEKRQAQVLYHVQGHPDAIKEHMRKAADHYWKAYESDRGASWALVQYLALKAALDGVDSLRIDLWFAATALAESEVTLNYQDRRLTWAHGSLMELYLLGSVMPQLSAHVDPQRCIQRATEHAAQVVKAGVTREIYTTWRQLRRYTDFFPSISAQYQGWPLLIQLAASLLKEFPPEPSYY